MGLWDEARRRQQAKLFKIQAEAEAAHKRGIELLDEMIRPGDEFSRGELLAFGNWVMVQAAKAHMERWIWLWLGGFAFGCCVGAIIMGVVLAWV